MGAYLGSRIFLPYIAYILAFDILVYILKSKGILHPKCSFFNLKRYISNLQIVDVVGQSNHANCMRNGKSRIVPEVASFMSQEVDFSRNCYLILKDKYIR